MIDLTSRTVDEINGLIQKYTSVLELYVKQQQHIPYLAVVIDVGVKHIKEKHADLPLDWKTWSIVYLKHKYFKNKIPKESDIPELIDEFIGLYKEKYDDYINDLGLSASEFDRDFGFVHRYI